MTEELLEEKLMNYGYSKHINVLRFINKFSHNVTVYDTQNRFIINELLETANNYFHYYSRNGYRESIFIKDVEHILESNIDVYDIDFKNDVIYINIFFKDLYEKEEVD